MKTILALIIAAACASCAGSYVKLGIPTPIGPLEITVGKADAPSIASALAPAVPAVRPDGKKVVPISF